MLGVTKRCQVDGCERAASANCFCCNKNVCRRHFLEHTDVMKAQIDPLANDTNVMVEKIQSLTIDTITESSFIQLQQWKNDMHRLIDETFSVKTKEMKELINTNNEKFIEHQKQQLEVVMGIQDQVKKLVEDGDVTLEQTQSLKAQLAVVQTNLSNFQTNFLVVNTTTTVQGLVTISTNLNRTGFPFPTFIGLTSSRPDNSKPTQFAPLFGNTTTQLPVNISSSISQNNPTILSSTSLFATQFGAVPTNTSDTTGVSSSSGPTNNGFLFNNQPLFSFGQQTKK